MRRETCLLPALNYSSLEWQTDAAARRPCRPCRLARPSRASSRFRSVPYRRSHDGCRRDQARARDADHWHARASTKLPQKAPCVGGAWLTMRGVARARAWRAPTRHPPNSSSPSAAALPSPRVLVACANLLGCTPLSAAARAAQPVPRPSRAADPSPPSSLAALPRPVLAQDGSFHCDEVLGCALLHRTARFANADVVRTRDPAKLAECDIVIDVSGECVPESMKFDHHQRSFTETFSDDKVRSCKVAAGGS